MIITDAIAGADSWQAIFSLLTAYLEAMQFHTESSRVPEHLTSLPLRGVGDLAARHEWLSALMTRTASVAPATLELAQICSTALSRLRALEGQWPRAA